MEGIMGEEGEFSRRNKGLNGLLLLQRRPFHAGIDARKDFLTSAEATRERATSFVDFR